MQDNYPAEAWLESLPVLTGQLTSFSTAAQVRHNFSARPAANTTTATATTTTNANANANAKRHATNAAPPHNNALLQVDAEVSSAISEGKSLYSLDTDLLVKLGPSVILTQDICSVCAIDLETVERAALRMDPSPAVVSLNPAGLADGEHLVWHALPGPSHHHHHHLHPAPPTPQCLPT